MALRGTFTKGGGWALETVRATAKPRERSRRLWDWACRAVTAEKVTLPPLQLSSAILLLTLSVSFAGHWINVDVTASFAPSPDNLSDSLSALWQAHTAIIGLSIPLLVLLVEQAKSSEVLPTSAGQAMISRSWVVVTTYLALGSVIVVGITATYLVSYATLITNTVLSGACVLLILHGYARALGLLLSPSDLRQASEELLMKRLEESIRVSFEVAAANESVTNHLGAWHPETLPRPGLETDATWQSVVSADHDGVVDDINMRNLRRLLLALSPPTAQAQQLRGDNGQTTFGSTQPRVLFAPIGIRVREGDPILAIRSSTRVPDLLALREAFKIGPSDE